MQDEAEIVRRMRNAVAYQGIKNSIVEWMNSPAWSQIPGFMNVRGECVERWISSKRGARITRIVANGMVSGEFNAR